MLHILQQRSKNERLAHPQAQEGFLFEKGVVMSDHTPVPSVLIADADPYLCRVFEAKLHKDNQFDVVVANTGTEASLAALKRGFSLVLWDSRLRDTSRFLPRLRALCPRASILLMTTDDRPTLDFELRRLDIAEILIKPFSLDTLIEKLRRSLASPIVTEKVANLDFARVGQRLTLISPAGVCMTRVLDRYQDAFAVVGSPRVETPSDFALGLPVRVEINGEDALYYFQSRLSKFRTDPVPSWELPLPTRIYREQRRKRPRYRVTTQIRMESLENPESISNESNAAKIEIGSTEDLSMSGCVLVSESRLVVGSRVRFEIGGATMPQIEGEAKVVRVEPLFESGIEARNHIALQFEELASRFNVRLKALVEANAGSKI